MPTQEVLILCVTKMLTGVCTAGMTRESDPVTGLKWIRPVKDFGTLLLGDLTDRQGTVIRPFDVVTLSLQKPNPDPPHVEDWLTDFVRHRPRIVRRLEDQRRAGFLARYPDPAPHDVLAEHSRSLCLLRPDWVQGRFLLDRYSGKYEARLTFALGGQTYAGSRAKGGLPVTDLRWWALGRQWLGDDQWRVDFDQASLHERLGTESVYLTVGLSRSFEGTCWPLVLGVHTVPDYNVTMDYTVL